MAFQVRLSQKFVLELDSICDFIAKDSVFFAALFAKRAWRLVQALNRFPNAGRVVPEYQDKTLREKFLGHYRIVYRVHKTTIQVLTICHGSRLLDEALK